MILPTIHLNGTGAKMLFADYRAAMDAIQDAQEAIRKIEFNARDYYPQGNEAWSAASQEMQDRRLALQRVHDDFLAICLHIQDEAGKRGQSLI